MPLRAGVTVATPFCGRLDVLNTLEIPDGMSGAVWQDMKAVDTPSLAPAVALIRAGTPWVGGPLMTAGRCVTGVRFVGFVLGRGRVTQVLVAFAHLNGRTRIRIAKKVLPDLVSARVDTLDGCALVSWRKVSSRLYRQIGKPKKLQANGQSDRQTDRQAD